MAEKKTGFDLASVLRDVSNLDTNREQIEYIDIDLIDGDPNNFYELSEIDGLAANIELVGLQQPLRVRTSAEDPARVMIVSGHRRRAAIRKLVDEGREDLREVACIREAAATSGALQELRLIYANSDTRRMTSSDISKQAERVEALLYQLKEEGYEFPGRMRDHVAEACKVSKTKLARLKVIRDNLAPEWRPVYERDDIKESVAYALAQLPEDYQQSIYKTLAAKGTRIWLYESYVTNYAEVFKKIDALVCKKQALPKCRNIEQKRAKIVADNSYYYGKCEKCCSKCSDLAKCKYACPALADKVKKLKENAREQRRQEKLAEAERQRPLIEQLQQLWYRFGIARAAAGKSIKAVYDATDTYYSKGYEADFKNKEELYFEFKPDTTLPYGYSFGLSDANKLIRMADLLGCSLDYLFCRTDNPGGMADPAENTEPAAPASVEILPATWYPVSVEPPINVDIIIMAHDGFVEDTRYCGSNLLSSNAITTWSEVVRWSLAPTVDAALAIPAPPMPGWKPGTENPAESIDAVAVFDLDGKVTIRKLAHWDGSVWSFLSGATIEARCIKWYPLPDDKEDSNV